MIKTKYIFLLIFTACIFTTQSKAQFKNNTEAAFYDMGFGAIIGGVGAVINKKPKEKTGNVFLKGLWQGAIGGYLVFESKRLIKLTVQKDAYTYFWPSKIVNSIGNSILENAAANKNFWENYHINLGFNRFEIDLKNKGKFSYKIMPFALYTTIENFTHGNFDFNKTLKTGSFVFELKKPFNKIETIFNSINPISFSKTNQILYNSDYLSVTNFGHEVIHIYQYEQFSSFNSLFIKPRNYVSKKSSFINFYTKYFYTDFNEPLTFIFSSFNKNYETNFFENEARFYTE